MLIPGCPVSGGGINSARRRGRLDGVRGIPNTTLSPPIMIDRLISGTHCTQVPCSCFDVSLWSLADRNPNKGPVCSAPH